MMLVSDPENLAKVRSSARILILLDKIVFSLAYELVEIINDVKLEFKFQVQDVRRRATNLGKPQRLSLRFVLQSRSEI